MRKLSIVLITFLSAYDLTMEGFVYLFKNYYSPFFICAFCISLPLTFSARAEQFKWPLAPYDRKCLNKDFVARSLRYLTRAAFEMEWTCYVLYEVSVVCFKSTFLLLKWREVCLLLSIVNKCIKARIIFLPNHNYVWEGPFLYSGVNASLPYFHCCC